MLAYAPADRAAARASSPRTLLLVILGHFALLAVVLTARGDLSGGLPFIETEVVFIDPVEPPPPPPPSERIPPRPAERSTIDRPTVIIPTPQPIPQPYDDAPPLADPTPYAGDSIVPAPVPADPPKPVLIRKAARFVTSADDVRPPYPGAKRAAGEEASLRLALQIDERGRVISVEPVGAADAAFLEAARRHILRRWRYAPATEGGTAIASRITVTLRFELDD